MKHRHKIFAGLFLATGVFAIVGALFTWGEGWLFTQRDGCLSLIPWADLMVAGPLSLLAGYGLWLKKKWGIRVGLLTCGIYLYGSAMVYIQVITQGAPYPIRLLVPPAFGLGIVCSFLIWINKR